MNVSLKSLISRINNVTREALEGAAALCQSRTHYDIEVEHFLLKLLERGKGDLPKILNSFGVNTGRFANELNRSLDKLKTGNARSPAFSPTLVKLLTEAWTVGSLEFGADEVRSGFTLLALLSDNELARIAKDISRELLMVQPEVLRRDLLSIVEGSSEATTAPTSGGTYEDLDSDTRPASRTPNLDQYTVNLTANAKAGKIDNVLGRDAEIRQIIDILMRRRQNNPILTGEAGVGKTAVVEGFALRVFQQDVPEPLKNVVVRTLDLALLQAGAGVKGEFENRLKGLIEEVKKSPIPIVLFIDEAHTMIGAGGQAGQNDAANLLKPALARGELRTIAATTWSEYKKYFEKDPALARRFQVVKVEEPSETQCMVMMRGIAEALEKHHKVRILDEGLSAAVRLSHRYLAGRQLPDKAVSVLDTACARLALGQNAKPALLEDLERQLADLEVQERILRRETATGHDHTERVEELLSRKTAVSNQKDDLQQKWEATRGLVVEIREIRAALEQQAASGNEGVVNGCGVAVAVDVGTLKQLNDRLDSIQGETVLTQVCVDAQIVGQVIAGWTGIPLGKMLKDEIGTVLSLHEHLERRVIGQDHSLKLISQRIQTGRASLDDPGKPVGVFLLVGPSGVGKTETALALSDLLYGGEQNLITINMSEFQEAHTVSTLKGSPPGYVGYGEGGVLTEAVRRRPYSVVLLDEVEKAHPDVLELFYQVFDKGRMEDGEGREIDFKNTIILLTSNASSDQLVKLTADPETMPSPEGIVKALKPELNKLFKPAFLGRMVIVPYYPLSDETLTRIIELKLAKIRQRMLENHRIHMHYDRSVIEAVAKRCTELESGARNVDNILTNTLLPDISRRLLTSISEGQKVASIAVEVGPDGAFQYS